MNDQQDKTRAEFEAWFEPDEHNRESLKAWRFGDGYLCGSYYLSGCWNGWQAATSAQEARIARLREALVAAEDALSEIALAGMSGTGMEPEEYMRSFHARQAWKFIGIAARATEAARAALKETQPGEQP